MSDFFNPMLLRKANKQHKCSYCGEAINKGDEYCFQKGNYEGSWFESKIHHECFADMCEWCDGEYTLYANERPKT